MLHNHNTKLGMFPGDKILYKIGTQFQFRFIGCVDFFFQSWVIVHHFFLLISTTRLLPLTECKKNCFDWTHFKFSHSQGVAQTVGTLPTRQLYSWLSVEFVWLDCLYIMYTCLCSNQSIVQTTHWPLECELQYTDGWMTQCNLWSQVCTGKPLE